MEIIRTNYQDGWIPTVQQEPPKDHIIATIKWSEDDYEATEVDYGVSTIRDKIIAWMPMPAPYEETK